MRSFYLGIVLLASQLILISCSGDDDGPGPGTPIQILPATTILMEFETFGVASGRQETIGHAIRAGGYVAAWKKFVNTGLAVPVTGYLVSTNKSPVYIDGQWIWSVDYEIDGKNYTSKLAAENTDNGVQWQMDVSASGEYSNFLSMRGFSETNRESGNWDIYKYPVDSVPSLSIAWNANSNGEITTMKYTAHKNDSYIDYHWSTNDIYNGFYDISNNGNSVKIAWNRTKKNGNIVEPGYYQDDLPRCWTSSFEDDECN